MKCIVFLYEIKSLWFASLAGFTILISSHSKVSRCDLQLPTWPFSAEKCSLISCALLHELGTDSFWKYSWSYAMWPHYLSRLISHYFNIRNTLAYRAHVRLVIKGTNSGKIKPAQRHKIQATVQDCFCEKKKALSFWWTHPAHADTACLQRQGKTSKSAELYPRHPLHMVCSCENGSSAILQKTPIISYFGALIYVLPLHVCI